MTKIIFLANCSSPHLDRWLDLLEQMGLDVEVWSIHPCNGKSHARQLLPSFVNFLPDIAKYALAGLIVRFNKDANIVHAHNTSGYGLTALLSGKDYIITTYGSEIFSAGQKKRLYNFLIQKVLDKAIAVTSTSSKMKDSLENSFGLKTPKIHSFSLGVDTKTFTPTDKSAKRPTIWVINRRMHPHYFTLETIQGFIAFLDAGHDGKLVVLMGDYDKNYADTIKNQIDFNRYKGQIECNETFLGRAELATFLQQATFSVSTPKSDQLSSSILESMACGTVPILSDLESYGKIINSKSCLVMTKYRADDFRDMFIQSSQMSCDEIAVLSDNGLSYIKQYESTEVVRACVSQLYISAGLIPQPDSKTSL